MSVCVLLILVFKMFIIDIHRSQHSRLQPERAVPPALIDEQGCLRKSSKSGLTERLSVPDASPTIADVVIVDVSQLFYHIVWPHGGSASDLITSTQSRLKRHPDDTEKIIVFDKYLDVSAKDHERL